MERPEPTDEEVLFDGGIMITETDLAGKITFANRKFVQMSAYEKDELIGESHRIMRHPDMPKCAFKDLWNTVKKGQSWKGYVKNLRKDGAFYWVIVYITPKLDDDGKHIGYIAARKVPERATLEEIKKTYAALLQKELETGIVTDYRGNMISEELTSVS